VPEGAPGRHNYRKQVDRIDDTLTSEPLSLTLGSV
jgi:hypothetical protein